MVTAQSLNRGLRVFEFTTSDGVEREQAIVEKQHLVRGWLQTRSRGWLWSGLVTT